MSEFYVACAVCALEFLHERRIVSRGLSPDGILLGADGWPKLGDFGCAKELGGAPRTYTFCGVAELGPAVGAEQDAVGREAAAHDPPLVQELERADGARDVELAHLLVEGAVDPEQPAERAAGACLLYTSPSPRD